uniref:Uncharacterized protein n=1 Tax=Oryza meridionalis TaxID=40149 RepID=A0A0E0ERK8_9ORYZ
MVEDWIWPAPSLLGDLPPPARRWVAAAGAEAGVEAGRGGGGGGGGGLDLASPLSPGGPPPLQRGVGWRPPARRPAWRGGGVEAGTARCRRGGRARWLWWRWRKPAARSTAAAGESSLQLAAAEGGGPGVARPTCLGLSARLNEEPERTSKCGP